MTPEEVNKKYGYGQANKKQNIRRETNQSTNRNQSKNEGGGFNMSVTKQKNIVGVFVFLILQIMFLLSNFTVAGVFSTLLLLLYLIVRNILVNNTEEKLLSVRLGNYISVSFLNISLITMFRLTDTESLDTLMNSDYIGIAVGVLVCAFLLIVAYFVVSAFASVKGNIGIAFSVLKYLIIFCAYSVFLCRIYSSQRLQSSSVIGLAIINLIFCVVDVYIKKVSEKTDRSILPLVTLSSTVIVLMALFDIDYTGDVLIYGFTHLNTLTSWKWYTVAIISIVFIAASSLCFKICYNRNIEEDLYVISDDVTNLFLIGFDIICFAIGIKFYTKYVAIFAIMLFMINLIILIVPLKVSKDNSLSKRIFNNKLIIELVMMGSLISLYFGFINGIIDIVLIILLSIVTVVALIDAYHWKYSLYLVLVAILGCDIAYHWHNSPANFFFIGIAFVLFSAIMIVIGIYNKKCIKELYNINLSKLCVLVLAIVIMLTPMVHTGAYIYDKVEVPSLVLSQEEGENNDSATITIKIRPHGKDNKVEACSYYWTSNEDEIFIQVLEDNSFSVKKKGADTLVVVCYDSNGVRTTYKHSYNIKV